MFSIYHILKVQKLPYESLNGYEHFLNDKSLNQNDSGPALFLVLHTTNCFRNDQDLEAGFFYFV